MKLYVICYQDSYEPWGWAPLEVDYHPDTGERDCQPFHWTREAAEAELARLDLDPEKTCCNYMIREFDVPLTIPDMPGDVAEWG